MYYTTLVYSYWQVDQLLTHLRLWMVQHHQAASGRTHEHLRGPSWWCARPWLEHKAHGSHALQIDKMIHKSPYCWWFRNPANQLRLVVCPIIYRFYTSQMVQDFWTINSMFNHQKLLGSRGQSLWHWAIHDFAIQLLGHNHCWLEMISPLNYKRMSCTWKYRCVYVYIYTFCIIYIYIYTMHSLYTYIYICICYTSHVIYIILYTWLEFTLEIYRNKTEKVVPSGNTHIQKIAFLRSSRPQLHDYGRPSGHAQPFPSNWP